MGRKGVEPSTFRLSVERSTKLSYRPNLLHTSVGALFQRQFKFFFIVNFYFLLAVYVIKVFVLNILKIFNHCIIKMHLRLSYCYMYDS